MLSFFIHLSTRTKLSGRREQQIDDHERRISDHDELLQDHTIKIGVLQGEHKKIGEYF